MRFLYLTFAVFLMQSCAVSFEGLRIEYDPVVAVTSTFEPTPTQEIYIPTPEFYQCGRVNTTKLNVRLLPGIDKEDIGDVYLGEVVCITETNDLETWGQAETENGVLLGWVDLRYVTFYND